jgi:hypothetical protein
MFNVKTIKCSLYCPYWDSASSGWHWLVP